MNSSSSSTSIANISLSQTNESKWIDKYSKRFTFKLFEKFTVGLLTIVDGDGVYAFGEKLANNDCNARIDIHHPSAYRALLMDGTNGAAEAYINGSWSTPDLLKVVQFMVKNLKTVNAINTRKPFLSQLASQCFHLLRTNTLSGSRKNISAHYDLSNYFFGLFLDESMMYSAAIYQDADTSLEVASINKLQTVCKKLELTEHDHLLEIGTGWGGLAIHAAKHYNCKVTTTTISKEQYDFATKKVAKLGLQNKITVLLKDYRDLEGTFDKLVSIEMIEAVGHQFYNEYFRQCNRLVKDNGLMLLQAITINDQRYHASKNSVDFIKKYIFPGGCLPSNEVVFSHVANQTNMQVIDLHDITPHYAKTLEDWRNRFRANIDKVLEMGFSESFCRLWEYYLCYCEGGFRERSISTVQYLLAKPAYRPPAV